MVQRRGGVGGSTAAFFAHSVAAESKLQQAATPAAQESGRDDGREITLITLHKLFKRFVLSRIVGPGAAD